MTQPDGSMKTTPANEQATREVDAEGYWRANIRLISILLVIWFSVSYIPVLFVEQLNQITILTGFPLGYYMGSQGSLIVFVLLIFYYSWRIGRLDREYGVEEE